MSNEIANIDGIDFLKTIHNNTIDLILTDPPYIISKNSGMNEHYNNVKNNSIISKTEFGIKVVIMQYGLLQEYYMVHLHRNPETDNHHNYMIKNKEDKCMANKIKDSKKLESNLYQKNLLDLNE